MAEVTPEALNLLADTIGPLLGEGVERITIPADDARLLVQVARTHAELISHPGDDSEPITPERLHGIGDRLDYLAGALTIVQWPEMATSVHLAANVVQNLANVIEYAEGVYGGEGMGEWSVDIDAGEVWRIARGETNERNET